jgi:hypothetical protein
LHAWAAEAIVVFVMMTAVFFEAQPAKLEFAFFASHVVTAFRFLNW